MSSGAGVIATRLMAASGKSLPHLMTAARKKGFKAVPLGVKAAHALPKRKLEIAFAVFLTCVVARFVWSLL